MDHEYLTLKAMNKLGSQKALSKYIGVAQPNVSAWMRGKLKIPAKHVKTLENLLMENSDAA